MMMFWGIWLDMQTVVAAAPPMHCAHKDAKLSSVLVHGLIKTLGSLVQEKSETGRAPGGDLFSFHVVLQSTRKADERIHPYCRQQEQAKYRNQETGKVPSLF